MMNFSYNACKITLYDLYLAENGKESGMSYRNWLSVGYLFLEVSCVR